MKVLISLMSFALGFSLMYINKDGYFVYFLISLFFIMMNSKKNKNVYTKTIFMPYLISSIASVFYLIFNQNFNVVKMELYLLIDIVLIIYFIFKGNEEHNSKEKVNVGVYMNCFIVPFLFPFSIYFLGLLFFKNQIVSEYLFYLLGLFLFSYFSYYFRTKTYVTYYLLTQIIAYLYISNSFVSTHLKEKVLWIGILIVGAIFRYKQNKSKMGGHSSDSLVYSVSRKKI